MMKSVLWLFDKKIRQALSEFDKENINEIRMRVGQPIILISKSGKSKLNILCSKEIIQSVLFEACEGSIYSHQEQINRGYVTIKGGHRIGLCGTAVYTNGEISNIKHITSLNIRIAKEHKNSALKLIEHYKENGVCNTLIIGQVGSGKTTLLRDTAKTLSNENPFNYNVCVVDERMEICNCVSGEMAFDMGVGCDCLSGIKKADGIDIAIRTMAPDVVIFDEFSGKNELKSVENCFNSGVKIIASIHAKDVNDFLNKPSTQYILTSKIFDYFVFLKDFKVEKIIQSGEFYD